MKIQHPLVLVLVALSTLVMAGCATDREAQSQSVRVDAALLSVTNSAPGSTYEIRVYVIQRGDTLARIARQFGISLADLMAINPDVYPARLTVGQEIRVSEKLMK
jgi:LysM repeat protein